jgi:hypothetical protein
MTFRENGGEFSMADYFRCAARVALVALAFCAVDGLAQDAELIAGQNINMVSGTEWPEGDPFLQRQNEGSLAISTRNEFHLMGGSNDYRTVDLQGLPEGKTIGDSWVSTYFSIDGGGRWTSTLLPGYPQDMSVLGAASPIHDFEASADPVVRAGTHGLFYYSGIAFNRGIAPASAGFVATFMDLNNDERRHSIGYVRKVVFDQNVGTDYFIDKPWIAVDIPRFDPPFYAQMATFDVHLDPDGIDPVSQTADCGNVYVAYARIQGDGTVAISSQIMFTRSEDCGATFSDPIQLSLPNTINQGATVAVDPGTGDVQVAWRQFENATLNCVRDQDYWASDSNVWPVDQIDLAGTTYFSGDAASLFPDDEKGGEPWLVLRQLLAAWLNALSGADISDISATMAEAEAWLDDNPPGSKPKKPAKKEGDGFRKILRDYNQGKSGLVSCDDLPDGGLSGLNPDAIIVTRSTNGGRSFAPPVTVTGLNYFPFEQGTTEFSFRTTSYPTMIFDGAGRSYIAYATRGLATADADPVGGDSRIVVRTSLLGTTWTAAQVIDEPNVPGHQIMPSLAFSRGQVFLLYYDFRRDLSGVFDRFIVDLSADPTTPRHSTDVRAAVADAADFPVFTNYSVLNGGSTQASRYPFLVLNDEFNQPFSQQTLFDLPNLPMFRLGTVPFFSDYVDIATLQFVTDDAGNWQFDTDPARGAPVAHAMWTDNRDVLAPPDGDWTSYVPPGSTGGTSIFDPTKSTPVCTPEFTADLTQMRNQNVYTSRLTQGLAAAIPGNNRQLGTIGRAFVGFVQNMTDEDKSFRLTILNQPPGGSASFDQFAPEIQRDVDIDANSSISQSIFVSSTNASASVDIRVEEIVAGVPVLDGLTALLRINPDATAPPPEADDILSGEVYTPAIFNPAIFNPAIFNAALLGTEDVGIYNPAIFNPAIFNNPEGDADFLQAAIQALSILNPAIFNPAIFNPAIFNPAIFNPAIFNPAIFNPAIFNPAIFNPAIFNPAIFNPAIFNPAIFNPAIFNPAIFNPAIFNPAIFNSSLVETSILVANTGNATAAYSLNLNLDDVPAGFLFQLMIYRTYLVPSANGCSLTQELVQEQLVNELLPDVDGDLLDPDSTSFYLVPGDNVVVTLRIVPDPVAPGNPDDIDTLPELILSQSVVPQAVDTAGVAAGETEPTPVLVLPPVAGGPAATILSAGASHFSWGGANKMDGWEFSPTEDITVTALGVFDLSGCTNPGVPGCPDGLVDNHEVGIWTTTGVLLGSTPVLPGTVAKRFGQFRYVKITPIDLSAGQSYVVASFNPSPDNDGITLCTNGTIGDVFFDPRITFVQGHHKPFVGGFSFPIDGGSSRPLPCFGGSFLMQANESGINNALSFDGLDDVVRIPHDPSLSLQALTLEAWVNIQIPPASLRHTFISKGFNFGNYTFAIRGDVPLATARRPAYTHDNATGNFSLSGVAITFGTWTHVAVTYSGGAGGTAKVYINGALARTGISVSGAPLENIEDLLFGSLIFGHPLDQRFSGLLDEVRIWNIVRSDIDIANGYNQQVASDTPGLVGYWSFDEHLSAQTAIDSSLFGNHGTLGLTAASGTDDPQRITSPVPVPIAIIDSVNVDNPTITINSPVPSSAIVEVINNAGVTLVPISVSARIDQGAASRLAGGQGVVCGLGDGFLPPGSCSFGYSFLVSNAAPGSGALTAGPATITFTLTAEFGVVLDTLTLPITLVGP